MNGSIDQTSSRDASNENQSKYRSVYTSNFASNSTTKTDCFRYAPLRPFNSATLLSNNAASPAEVIGDCVESYGHDNEGLPKSLKILVPLDGKIWKSISARTPRYRPKAHLMDILSAREREVSSPNIDNRFFHVKVSINGIIHISNKENMHIEITLDRSVRVRVPGHSIQVCISNTANASAVYHPNGRIIQNNSRVDLVIVDGEKRNNFVRFAKMWFKGISFSSKNCPLVYLVDAAGVRSTVDRFPEILEENASEVFYSNSRYGYEYVDEASKMLADSSTTNADGSLEIHDIRISHSADGVVSIQRPNNKCTIRINPKTGSVALTTLMMHCTASRGPTSHLFIKRADRRIHFNGTKLCVRNGGHSAGFDERNQFKIFI